jgi:hypothetical protein
MSEYYHRYILKNNLYSGSTDDVSDPAHGYTQVEFPQIEYDFMQYSWRWTGDGWELISIEDFNRIMNEE